MIPIYEVVASVNSASSFVESWKMLMFCRASMQRATRQQPQSLKRLLPGLRRRTHSFRQSPRLPIQSFSHSSAPSRISAVFTALNPSDKATAQRSICQTRTREVCPRQRDKLMPAIPCVGHVTTKGHSQHARTHSFSRSQTVSRATHRLSAPDNALFRNDPGACCKLQRTASTPAFQPRIQTLLRPQGTTLFCTPAPHNFRALRVAEPRSQPVSATMMPCLSLGFPQSLICSAC
ncbi:hypothetical protein C7974DRAFT_182617 [Boeremia exigua]|uniref:uncharacterized protein n=1 Tax=Boeremia exigua TaxID=749465 RepID=UPI001E8DF745|nr:uncharacterized protein C7974DRAFT_182617 [Boeremia exigua]KAH6629186.1 hypothetical protein C7974DRAFT_182617 [Boeremia exigua]